MFLRPILILGILGCLSAQPPAPGSARRRALVIGNGDYRSLPRIPSAAQEADLVTGALKNAGFVVDVVRNVTVSDFFTKENAFLKAVQAGDVCLVYYSGYAVQGDQEDDNYLLPIDFEPQSDKPMAERAYHLERLQTGLENRHAALKMFVLEASRSINTPITGAGHGLMEPHLSYSTETSFWFSASPGQAIAQNDKGRGRFTEAVAQYMGESGLRLSEVFDRIKRQVTSESQFPAGRDNVTQDFYFHAAIPVERAAEGPKAGDKRENPKDKEDYIYIAPGTFLMGCVPTDKCDKEELPRHRVTISKGFLIGKTAVTAAAYKRFARETDREMPPAPRLNKDWKYTDHPVTRVSWEDANEFCKWVGGRLPTEAEREYAARGALDGKLYPWGDDISHDRANYEGTRKGTRDEFEEVGPVMSFDPNSFGLYEMAGNVWEWCWDWFDPKYYQQSEQADVVDPKGPDSGKQHVARGGSAFGGPRDLRVSHRIPAETGNKIGFRCVWQP